MKIVKLLIVLVVLGLVVGCAKQKAEAPKDKTLTFALCPKSLNNPFWTAVEDGMRAKGKELGIKTEFVAPVEADSQKQVSMIEGLIARRINGIAISPNDPKAVRGVISKAIAAGIPTICFDADAPDTERICYVGTDNTKAGEEAGRQMVKAMGGRGKYAIITGGMGAFNLNQRIAGFRKSVKAAPGMKEVAFYPCDDDEAKAHEIIESLLQAHSDLGGIYAVGLWAANPAGKILKREGKVGKVKVVGFDTTESTIQLVKDGSVQALIGQRPYEMGRRSVEILNDLNQGKKPSQEIISTGIDVVTKENVSKFMK